MPGHGHVWRHWTDWQCVGNGQDMRERHCMDARCGAVETQWRRCQHQANPPPKKRRPE